MQKVRSFLKSRGALLAIVAMALGSTLGLTSPVKVAQAQVCAWRPVIRTYYSDATHTTVVGERGLNCNCDDISWGVTSAYVVNFTQCCNFFTC